MYPGREVFRNAPLEYVAVEIRFPYAPRLRQQDTVDAVLLAVQDVLPIIRSNPHVTVTATIGGSTSQQIEDVRRAFNRTSTAAALVTSTALTIETTDYDEFDRFKTLVGRCADAVVRHGSVVAVERIGLRFVNEIRVPTEIADARDWRGWVQDDLLGGLTLSDAAPGSVVQGGVEFITGDMQTLAVRYAAADGAGVIGDAPLRRRHRPPNGPFFVLDLDSYWQPLAEAAPAFERDGILSVVEDLHAPVGAAFQRAITDQLREVLRGDSDG